MNRWFVVVLACAACASTHPPAVVSTPHVAPSGPPRIANLHAFARLYGVVRWFHPSDAAAAVDWDRFAIEGARRAVDAADPGALRATLTELFAQVAPTMTIAGPGEALTDDPALHPASTAGLDVVAWEHYGYGDSTIVSVYRSKRRHRTTEPTKELFDDAPRPGETVDLDLGSGLRARVPIALYSQDGHTLGDRASLSPAPQPRSVAGYDAIAGVADVIVAWNAIEHFWPYWDDVPLDWGRELDRALAEALADRSPDDHLATLERLAAAAPDGHASVSCPATTLRGSPQVALEWIEEHAVVTASKDDRLAVGDVVTAIDGRPIVDAISAAEARVSGSPQWKRERVMAELASGAEGSTVVLRVQRATGDGDIALTRVRRRGHADTPAHPALEQLADGVWYVDLARAEMRDIDAAMDKLAAAPGVVLDMRGYPNNTHPVLSHVLSKDEDTKWMWIPKFIRPDHAPHAWDGVGWNLPALTPHIAGKVAVLTGPRAISYAESVMGFVEAETLGAIFGTATAGTNGNIAEIREPTGCRSIFTGMRVTKHDGSRHHLIGVQPTVPIVRTIAGVRAGKDEVLDAALAWIAQPRGK